MSSASGDGKSPRPAPPVSTGALDGRKDGKKNAAALAAALRANLRRRKAAAQSGPATKDE